MGNMTEESEKKAKVKRQDSTGSKGGDSARQLLLAPGPSRILCAPSDSREYTAFLCSFCSTYQTRHNDLDFNDIGLPEVRSLVQHIKQRNGSDNATIMAREIQVLMIICRSPSHKAMFVANGGVQAVIGALRRYAAYPDVQVQGCKAMVNLGKGYQAKVIVGINGGLQSIVDAMGEHQGIVEVQEMGCWAIGSVVAAHQENKSAAADCGAVEAVVEAVRAYPAAESLQQVGLWSLGSLAANFAGNAARIGRKGGVTHVISVMKGFVDNPAIQEMGCWALANMAAGGGKPADYIVKKEGPAAVMGAMRKWDKNPNLQYAGLVALAHLGSDAAMLKLMSMPAFVFFQ